MADGAVVVDGHTAMAELLSAGEFTVAASAYTDSIDDSIGAGAPVARTPTIEPLILKPAGVGIVRGTDRPAAAALFTEWMLTEAQPLILESRRVPASVTVGDPLEGAEVIHVPRDVYSTNAARWTERWSELVG